MSFVMKHQGIALEKKYEDLTIKEDIKVIRKMYPVKISEAEPKDVGGN